MKKYRYFWQNLYVVGLIDLEPDAIRRLQTKSFKSKMEGNPDKLYRKIYENYLRVHGAACYSISCRTKLCACDLLSLASLVGPSYVLVFY